MTLTPAVGSRVSGTRGMALIAILSALLAVPGCRESATEPDAPEGNVVLAGSGDWGNDPYMANRASIDGDRLTIEVSFAGGCRTHAFTLVTAASFMESDPVQLSAVLAHDADGDPCQAWLTESHVFDLTLVRTRYQQFYGPGPGKVVLQIDGVPGEDLVYEFDG